MTKRIKNSHPQDSQIKRYHQYFFFAVSEILIHRNNFNMKVMIEDSPKYSITRIRKKNCELIQFFRTTPFETKEIL